MTLSTLDNQARKKHMGKISFVYLLISLFCVLLGAVYEYFSHEVYSVYMIYAFIYPLLCGALPFAALSLYGSRKFPGRLHINLYNAGIATLTVGSVMQGVVDIYGTTNTLIRIYWYAGLALMLIGVLMFLMSRPETKPKAAPASFSVSTRERNGR